MRHIVNNSGTVIDQITYDSFGKVLSETNPSNGDRFKFTGREYDAETGLYYYRARYYDPNTGRFLEQDPIGFAAGDANLYRYVGNSPTNATDPSGLMEWWFWPSEWNRPGPPKSYREPPRGTTAGDSIPQENKDWANNATRNFVPTVTRGTFEAGATFIPGMVVDDAFKAIIAGRRALQPVKCLFGKTISQVEKNIPKSWRRVAADRGHGWKWLDENGVERIRYMHPKKGFDKYGSGREKGYWRWKDAAGNDLDEYGRIVPTGSADFEFKTHIPYTGGN